MCYASRRLFVYVALYSSAALGLQAQSVQEIADRIAFARGGRAKIHSIQTERMTGHVIAGEQVGSFVMEVKRPGKVRLEIQIGVMSVTRTYDGKAGWKRTSPGQDTAQRMNENDAKQLIGDADIDGPFLDFDPKATQIEIVDREMLGPSLVWKLKVTLKGGQIDYYYVESTGYMVLLREEITSNGGQNSLSRQFYQNFQRVQNVPFPFTIIAENSNSDQPLRLDFDTVELNLPEEDSRFFLTPMPK
jgi:hypothetical protein